MAAQVGNRYSALLFARRAFNRGIRATVPTGKKALGAGLWVPNFVASNMEMCHNIEQPFISRKPLTKVVWLRPASSLSP